ncbi:bifunctional metallophosphatase/5'-nucleotidase [Virgibacillus dakarensis]|uniref:Metallophosphoesterase YunD n=1 Tax=Lentibacillus populi TaxID=1827502 RepID=A0A9W5TW62_9BACI|nr:MULTISPECIES: bifunctional UDP-sugar hydrolase/5'-nucleotidase [Bacillaceae]MBT2217585.1 bifunctional metallophosphatase/5'-nucleotidase [Virgibacillus dakarensis]MTW84706.1 bifunctional metallophosphatase/5'-nucleotidase [Virgibacillus dakarensis]GGB36488.1 putative metallophosphoesterase YunD [Lentibacillus populi]
MQEKLCLYYTNDLHSNFSQWPRVAGYLKEAKASKAREQASCLLMDVGDHVDRVHPIAEAFMGKANVQLMNDVGYDVVTLGNNEGITLGHEDLYHLYDDADFQVVCANLHDMAEKEPDWLKPVVYFRSVNGVRIGVIGLTAPFNNYYELLQWHVSNPFKALEKYIKSVKEAADIVILLSHLGISEDQAIARRFSEIDVIIGGHTHHLLRTGENVNNTIITAAGKHCTFVGEVILTWDHQAKKLVHKEAYTTDITHLAKDSETEKMLQQLYKKANNLLGQTVVHLHQTIEVKWFQETAIMRKLTDTMKMWTKADCAMLNSGLLLDELSKGDVTYKDIHRICPHPINPCVVELTGDELTEVVRASFTKDLMELKLKGFGFRGEVIGRMVFSGLAIATTVLTDGRESVKNVFFQGEPLDPDRIYSVAVADTFTFGRLLPEIAKSETKQYFLPEFLRDLLAYTLRNDFDGKAD